MSIQNAAAIVQRIGPCRILIDRAKHVELARELGLIGCDVRDPSARLEASSATTAGFVAWPQPGATGNFADAVRPFAGADILIVQTETQARATIERTLLTAGWSRHPASMMFGEHTSWSSNGLPVASFYQKAGRAARKEPLLSGGADKDSPIARYTMAAQHVRPGDTVLVDGFGASDGTRILSALSRAGSVLRIGQGGIDASLDQLSDHTVDAIVALEPAIPADWVSRLDDYARVLRHDGRIVFACKAAARGDNRLPPDWATLLGELSERFLVETRYLHVPIDATPGAPEAIIAVPLDQDYAVDWLIAVASANPLLGEEDAASFSHPCFADAGATPLVDFGAAYDNPWLYRTMVQMGERLGDEMKLARLAECVIDYSRPDSADRGAAIAVLGYRILELRLTDLVPKLIGLIDAYAAIPIDAATPPHVRRWWISLNFLGGRLSELAGERAAAKAYYRTAATGDWAGFSPLLATKAIAGSFFEARLRLADGEHAEALACFRRGVDVGLAAASAPHAAEMGDPERPLPFYLQELAEVIDMGSQCANALANADLLARDPGLFWRQVDVRRFGLASWARDVEKENERLRARA